MVEIGQVCDHELVPVGRHRVCRQCIAVYAAVAGPSELSLLGQYSAVLALLDEYVALADDLALARAEVERLRVALEDICQSANDDPSGHALARIAEAALSEPPSEMRCGVCAQRLAPAPATSGEEGDR